MSNRPIAYDSRTAIRYPDREPQPRGYSYDDGSGQPTEMRREPRAYRDERRYTDYDPRDSRLAPPPYTERNAYAPYAREPRYSDSRPVHTYADDGRWNPRQPQVYARGSDYGTSDLAMSGLSRPNGTRAAYYQPHVAETRNAPSVYSAHPTLLQIHQRVDQIQDRFESIKPGDYWTSWVPGIAGLMGGLMLLGAAFGPIGWAAAAGALVAFFVGGIVVGLIGHAVSAYNARTEMQRDIAQLEKLIADYEALPDRTFAEEGVLQHAKATLHELTKTSLRKLPRAVGYGILGATVGVIIAGIAILSKGECGKGGGSSHGGGWGGGHHHMGGGYYGGCYSPGLIYWSPWMWYYPGPRYVHVYHEDLGLAERQRREQLLYDDAARTPSRVALIPA